MQFPFFVALLPDNGYNETVQNGSENMRLERKEQT